MSSITDYFTADKASEGLKIDLPRPDGAKSTDWAIVRGEDSPEYKAAYSAAMRELLSSEHSIEDSPEVKLKAEVTLGVALIKEWSFKQPVTVETITELIEKAPYLWKEIEVVSQNRSLFAVKKPKASSTTRKRNSSSRAKSKAEK